jgi:hypothetical protein
MHRDRPDAGSGPGCRLVVALVLAGVVVGGCGDDDGGGKKGAEGGSSADVVSGSAEGKEVTYEIRGL